MYQSPSIYVELARQRHQDFLAEARRERLAAQTRRDADRGARFRSVDRAFAGIVAAVTRLMPHGRPAATQVRLSTTD
jgi:hypothetical protein